ncbi:SAM-dependent methyltransferase [Streptomyces lydicus]|uniref:SAM-dependent methyltransferase n=1 Tax=Streptomyces lydicus TaxID=47763 RepID=UPI0036EF3160
MRHLFREDWACSPSEPRVYDYLLGGDDNFAVDRALGDALVRAADWLPRAAQINRSYGGLTVAHLARRGIRQFLDLGCGYPAPSFLAVPDAHEAAVRIRSDAIVVHVDQDPVVATHAAALMAGPHGEHGIVCEDIRRIDVVLATPEAQKLDFDQPVGVLVHDVLPWIPDDDEVRQLLTVLRGILSAGSAISITHATCDMRPHESSDIAALYEEHGLAFRPRSYAEFRALHEPWPLDGPGVLPTGRWHTDPLHAHLPDAQSGAYAAVSLHPDPALCPQPRRRRTLEAAQPPVSQADG